MAEEKDKLKEDIYDAVLIEAASPFTKRPSTPFRPAALLLLSGEYCYKREELPGDGDSPHRPSPIPVVPGGPNVCDSVAYAVRTFVERGFKVRVNYLVKKPDSIKYEYDETLVGEGEDGHFKALAEGKTTVKVIALFGSKECTTEVPVEIEPKPETPPEPVECSLVAESVSVNMGDEVELKYTDSSGRTAKTVAYTVDNQFLEKLSDSRYKAIKVGETIYKVTVTYEDGSTCEAEAQVTINEVGCTVDMEIKYNNAVAVNPVKVMVGTPITLTFRDNGAPFAYTSIKVEGIDNVQEDRVNGTATVIPKMDTASGTYKVTVSDGIVTCSFDLVLEVTKYRDVTCGTLEDSKGSAFTIFHYPDMPAGRYYVSYDMYGIPDDIYVFDGEPDKADSIVLHGAVQVKDKENSPFYFDYAKTKGDIYIQMNTENVTVSTGYEVKLYCPGDTSQESTAKPPTPLPNPNL